MNHREPRAPEQASGPIKIERPEFDARIGETALATSERRLRFARAPRGMAGAMLVAIVVTAASPGLAVAKDPKVTISLPPPPNGETNSEDDVAPGTLTAEDEPEAGQDGRTHSGGSGV